MALWVVRAGQYGQHEQRFLDEKRVYMTWHGLHRDLSRFSTREEVVGLVKEFFPDRSKAGVRTATSQCWAFVGKMTLGDWVALPSKQKPAVHIAEITGPYTYDAAAKDPYYHYRQVSWLQTDIPRSNFAKDVLRSFNAYTTIYEVSRNNAETRVRAMADTGWLMKGMPESEEEQEEEQEEEPEDLEEVARDQIARLVLSKFKGYEMQLLVEAILCAQGYTTFLAPEGPDKGVDILAAPGPLGFGEPRICVQVKSGHTAVDRPTLDQLIGTMQNVQAQQGLLVSWGGFKSSIDREKATQFFRVRLWDQKDLIEQLLEHYDKLDDDMRAELPLKRIWTVSASEETSE
jgi:restriction system protein